MNNSPAAISKIVSDAAIISLSDELFTKALIALEQSNWGAAKQLCQQLMAISISIEQRCAVILLEGLANVKDKEMVKECLEKAYG